MKNLGKYLALIFTIIILSVLALPSSTAVAYTDGPYDAGQGANVSVIGSEAWQSPGEITQPGSPYTSVTLYHLHTISNYLNGYQYGFTIPPEAAILGIEVTVNRMADGNHPSISDNSVRLVKAGNITGDDKAAVDNEWSTTPTTATYGGPTDLWGTTWTSADINDPDFGAVISAKRDNNGNNDRVGMVDSMKITVYYMYTATTAVECGDGSPVIYGDDVLCVVTVTGVSGGQTPGGTVNWTTDGTGSFDPNPCSLTGSVGVSTCSATYTPGAVGTGSHLITAAYSGDDYFIPNQATDTLMVAQRPVTVTADPQTKVYGDPDPAFTYQITQGSLAFTDTFTGTLSRDAGEDVATYAILQNTLALSENYNLTYVGDFLTITRADATCPVTPYAVPYDGLAHTAIGECLGVMDEPLAGLDLSGTTHTDVGTYTDTWTFTDETGNYNDTSGIVDDEITPLLITVTADAKTKSLGQPDPELTYQVTAGSLFFGDVFSGELIRQPGERVGTYTILQGTLSLPDYYGLTFVVADFTISGYRIPLPLILR